MKKLKNVPSQVLFWSLTISSLFFVVLVLIGLPDWQPITRAYVMIIIFCSGIVALILVLRRILQPVYDLQERLKQEPLQILHRDPIGTTGEEEWWPDLTEPLQQIIDHYAHHLKSHREQAMVFDQYMTQIRQWLDQQAGIALKQKHLLQEFRVLVDDWAKGLPVILKQLDELQEMSRKHSEYSQYAQELIHKSEEDLSTIHHQIGFRRRLQDDLAKKIQSITILNKRIHMLTGQTKLIAFNAAIEAATTGEVGRRFNVVASDIRKLASIVDASNNDMREIVADIQGLFKELEEQVAKEEQPYEQIRSAWFQLTLMIGESGKIVRTMEMYLSQWIQTLHHQQTQMENMQMTFQEMQSAYQQFQHIHKQIKDNLQRRPGTSSGAAGSTLHRNLP